MSKTPLALFTLHLNYCSMEQMHNISYIKRYELAGLRGFHCVSVCVYDA